jgi:hypothetical protein
MLVHDCNNDNGDGGYQRPNEQTDFSPESPPAAVVSRAVDTLAG